MKIISPISTGSGASIIHTQLQKHIPGYQIIGYKPYWEFVPFVLPFITRASNADIIHCPPDYAVFVSRKNVPLVLTLHNYVLDSYMRPNSSLIQNIHYRSDLRLYYKLAVAKASILTAVSEFTADVTRNDLGIHRDIKIIYNGINTEIFHPKAQITPKKNTIRVLFSGNPTRRKGAHWLEAIAEKLDDNVEIIVTGGLRGENFQLQNNRIRFIGKIDHKDMPDLYNQVDMLIFPTVREGFSVAVLEAMACGLPVVASDCSSLPEQIIDGSGGYLCPVGDTKCFAEKINELAASPSAQKEMGDFNRSRVEEKFSLDRMINEYRKLFQEVLDTGEPITI